MSIVEAFVPIQRLKDFGWMLDVARSNPVYAKHMTDEYALNVLGAAAKSGRYVLMKDKTGKRAFFTHLRPYRPITAGSWPSPEDWLADGPQLWIGDVCCNTGITHLWLGKAVRKLVKKQGLAKPGEKCVYWRDDGRFGWFTVE